MFTYSTYFCLSRSTQALHAAAKSVVADGDGKRARHDAALRRTKEANAEEKAAGKRQEAARLRRVARASRRPGGPPPRRRLPGSGATEAARVARDLRALSAEVKACSDEPPPFVSRAAQRTRARLGEVAASAPLTPVSDDEHIYDPPVSGIR